MVQREPFAVARLRRIEAAMLPRRRRLADWRSLRFDRGRGDGRGRRKAMEIQMRRFGGWSPSGSRAVKSAIKRLGRREFFAWRQGRIDDAELRRECSPTRGMLGGAYGSGVGSANGKISTGGVADSSCNAGSPTQGS